MKIVLACLILMSFVSCGNPDKLWPTNNATIYKSEPAEAEEFSYELRTRSCSTGEHKFSTFKRACEALKNDELNNDCALDKRQSLFVNSECEGNFS